MAGLWTGSLALLADAAHMLTDAGGLALALLAIQFAERPATARSTYGFVRAEVLAALTNAVVLLVVTLFILYEAYGRFFDPPDVIAGPMMAVAIAGLAVNLASMKLLAAGSSESLNVKGAYFEVFADMLGSVGVLLAGAIVLPDRLGIGRSDRRRRHRPLHRAAHLRAAAPGGAYPEWRARRPRSMSRGSSGPWRRCPASPRCTTCMSGR